MRCKTPSRCFARRRVRISGTEQQFQRIDANLKRKGKVIAFTQLSKPGEGTIDVSSEVDFAALDQGDPLITVAKYAANYALYCTKRSDLTLALAEQARAMLGGRIDPTSCAGFIADPKLLNRMAPAPPHHTVMLAPIEGGLSRRRWAVVGMLPYYVVSPDIGPVLHLHYAAHRFRINESQAQETQVSGAWPMKPSFPANTFICRGARDRRHRGTFAARNALRMLTMLAEQRG